MAWHPNRHPFDILLERGAVIGDWRAAAGRILRVMASNGLQHERGILDGPGHRTAVIQGPAQRYDTVATHAPVGRLQPNHTAIGSRPTDRATGARAQRAHTETRRHCSARTTAGTAGDMGGIP